MNGSRICTILFGCLALALGAPGTTSNVARAGTQDVHAHSQHAASADMKQHHACLEEEHTSIERGDGFEMAMPADHAGYPGPRHVLDMAADLKLTAEQRTAMQAIFDRMHEKATARGKELFESEARLEQMFRDGRPEADLREQSFRVDSIHAELRWIHLSAHLAAQKILTVEQIARYTQIRHEQM